LCNASALEDPDNRALFGGYGVVQLPVQSNDPSCDTPGCDIRSICELLREGGGEPIEALSRLAALQWEGVSRSMPN
jgi:hypothetical protein